MNKADLSIIIPVYKVEDYLERCVDSVVCQMDEKLEIVLVDDGSPDKCPDICDKYAEKYNSIKVIHKKNGGLSDAVKEGILASTGKHIAFVDSDDWLEKEWYSSIRNVLLEHPDIDTIMYGFQRVENDEINRGKIYSLFNEGYYDGLNIKFIKHNYMKPGGIGPTRWNKVYSREIALKCLEYYDTRLSIGEDMVFSSIATDIMKNTYILKKHLVNYFINRDSMTHQFNRKYETSFEVLFQSLQRYFGDSSLLYYINYINMRTMVNALGKSDYKGKRKYLKSILINNKQRIAKVQNKDLKPADRLIKLMMMKCMPSLLLCVASAYRLKH